MSENYQLAQRAIADLKTAVLRTVVEAGADGIRNADVGRRLGIHRGYGEKDRHDGHLTLTLLKSLEEDRLVEQVGERGPFRIRQNSAE